jgi:galactokinase
VSEEERGTSDEGRPRLKAPDRRAGRQSGIAELFRARFGGAPEGVWLAPGRANLMGEHTDYNDGFVLPFALSQGTAAAAARRPGRTLTLCSRQEPDAVLEIGLDGLAPGQVTGWGAYPAGVAWALAAAGYQVPGACIAIDSDVPAGAGLSSSAALECATALALTELVPPELAGTELAGTELAGGPVPRGELAAIARRAENDFVGVPSGIMDQSASLLGQAGHALLLDCRSLERSQVPFDPAAAGSRLLLINTRARHELTDGGYGRRRAECEEAARLLGIPSLRYLTDSGETARLADPVLRRRARHVVTDNQRVLEVVALLRAAPGRDDTYAGIGRLLIQAHVSLRDDFEISWPEADAAVEAALAAGALGARMMGGGFGGCVLALVPEAACGPVRDSVTAAYSRHGWTAPDFLDAAPSDRARRLALPPGARTTTLRWPGGGRDRVEPGSCYRGRYQCRYVTRLRPSRAISRSCGTPSTASPRSAWTCRRRRPRCSTRWPGCRWRSAPAGG